MSTHWSISNRILPITFDEFKAMGLQFLQLVEDAFGGKYKVEVKAMNRVKLTTVGRRDDSIMAHMAQTNKRHTFFVAEDFAAVTAAVFNSAAYIEMTVTPLDPAAAPANAWAHAEFKGYKPKQATFFVRPDADAGARKMKSLHRLKIIGAGWFGNASSFDEKR
ncbi:MAG TPA: hypothetical protein V6C89_00560 [Drouetiella sp.]|jgi:hypothetical protein